MHRVARLEHVASFLIGLVAAFGLSRVTTWWLNSGFGVGTTMAVLCVLGGLTAGWGLERRRERLIALWLGHESPTTTHMYVEADLAMKQRALEKLDEPSVRKGRFRVNDDLLKFLDGL